MEQPITVLLPVRNGHETVGLALGDLLVGMGSRDEVVVIDDGSTDSTPTILALMSSQDTRLRVLRTQGIGLVGALNLGLKEAAHAWVARADADDRYPADRLAHQRAVLAEQDAVLVTGDYGLVGGGRQMGDIPCAITSPFVVASLIHPQRIPHPGVLFKREAVEAAGGYRQEDFPAEDIALWLRLARLGSLVGTPHRVVNWTISGASITHTRQAVQRQKTRELIKSGFPVDMARSLTRTHVEGELDAYVGTRLEDQRRLLLHRDLSALVGMGLQTSVLRPVRRAIVRSPYAVSRAAWQLVREKRQRDALRAGFG